MKLGDHISKLLNLSSAPLNQQRPRLCGGSLELAGSIGDELMAVLSTINGFYSFESALHFLPSHSSLLSVGIEEWNAKSGWRQEFGNLADDCLFFAEDVFGGQFCIANDRVMSFDPETGDRRELGASLNDWAQLILREYRVLTGYPLAHSWQQANGPLPEGFRLIPRTPFVCNGSFDLGNLALIDAERGMRIRGSLARQIHDLPDGSQIVFSIEG